MKKYFMLGVVVLFTLPLRTDAAVVTSDDVLSIAIDSTWSGLAKPRAYHDVIERRGGAFVRSGGSVVNDADVERFVNALNRPHPASLVAADAGLTPAALAAALPAAERCLRGGLSMPAVRAEFEREYFDSAALQQALDFWFRKPKMWSISDFYPSLSILVRTKTATVRIASSSQRPFMLPFVVDAGAGEEEVSDGSLALAVAGLMPPGAVNRDLFLTQSAISNWAAAICDRSSIRDAISDDGRAYVSWVAATFGLQLAGYTVSADLSSWNAEVRPADRRNLGAEVPYTNRLPGGADVVDALSTASQRISIVESVPWLRRFLDVSANNDVQIDPGGGLASWEIGEFEKSGRVAAGAYLKAHALEAFPIRLSSKSRPQKFSQWRMFRDGTAILQYFSFGMLDFPLDGGAYDNLPHAKGLAGDEFAGVLVHADGSVEKDIK